MNLIIQTIVGVTFTTSLYIIYKKCNKNNVKKGNKLIIKYYVEDPRSERNKKLVASDSQNIKKRTQEDIEIKSKLCDNDGSIFKTFAEDPEKVDCLINTKDCLGFLGIGADHATVFHLLIIPKQTGLQWYQDLEPEHIDLLENMRYAGECFVEKNKLMLDKISDNQDYKVRFGFHTRPTVGYLHLHMMVGPLSTQFDSYHDNWVDYYQVIEYIKSKDEVETGSIKE
jgi:hypothetical protein